MWIPTFRLLTASPLQIIVLTVSGAAICIMVVCCYDYGSTYFPQRYTVFPSLFSCFLIVSIQTSGISISCHSSMPQ